MATVDVSGDALKDAVKAALVEAILENREAFLDLIAEAMEDIGLAEAIREGSTGEVVPREDVFRVLEGGH